VGLVPVEVPKGRDHRGAGVKLNSALAPPSERPSARVAAALPAPYLRGVSSGDLGEALEGGGRRRGRRLSPAPLGGLKAHWSDGPLRAAWISRTLAATVRDEAAKMAAET